MPDTAIEQTKQIFSSIEAALKAVDSGLEDVICSRVFIQTPADTNEVMAYIGIKFRGVDPTTTVTCPPLGSSIYKVEIEVTAYRGASKADVNYIHLSD